MTITNLLDIYYYTYKSCETWASFIFLVEQSEI